MLAQEFGIDFKGIVHPKLIFHPFPAHHILYKASMRQSTQLAVLKKSCIITLNMWLVILASSLTITL